MNFANMTIQELIEKPYDCSCGMTHDVALEKVVIERGAIEKVPAVVRELGGTKPFVLCDKNTYAVAGEKVMALLQAAGMAPHLHIIHAQGDLAPDETSVGSAVMGWNRECDLIVAVGSGVLNDIGKVLAYTTGKKTMIVGTAPSMDGFASNSSSMIVDGVKTTLYNVCPSAIVCDTQIMAQAPMIMLCAGLGDMVAKYVSICEWKISHLVNGEHFCDAIAELMLRAVAKCVSDPEGLKNRDPNAVQNVVEGLVISGIAMSYGKTSRPASGIEHYFSHIWEMQTLMGKLPHSLHGVQVGVGTVLALRMYDKFRSEAFDKKRALAAIARFDRATWEENVQLVFGKSAPKILEIEAACGKNDPQNHAKRLAAIEKNWAAIMAEIEKLPSEAQILDILRRAGAPCVPADLTIQNAQVSMALKASREIRDKYIASSFLWDLGLLDEYAAWLEGTL